LTPLPVHIDKHLSIPDEEIRLSAIRAQGAGGQNVNKVASAVHLRFDVVASSLPQACKQRLLAMPDRRVSEQGVIVIKAQRFRTREKNTADALARLRLMVTAALAEPRKRIPTKPTRAAGERRLESKSRRGKIKQLRAKVS
jgi:ribosome-associated protein